MVRVRRMVMADSAAPRMIAGMIICLRFCQRVVAEAHVVRPRGDQPHQIDGKTITMVPSQKLGTASIRIENERPM